MLNCGLRDEGIMGRYFMFEDANSEQFQIIISRIDIMTSGTCDAFLKWTEGKSFWLAKSADVWFTNPVFSDLTSM
jgi:hypothetical protein